MEINIDTGRSCTTVNVSCTWGDGPDVLMDFSRNNRLYMVDLTYKQAEQLSQALLDAAIQARSLEDSAIRLDAEECNANMDV